jgi:dihydrofolate reductase
VGDLKRRPGGDILVYGSGTLVQTLMERDLVDQYRLMIFPVVVGSGKRLFKDGSIANLRLVDSKSTETGVLMLTYRPAPTDGEE